MQLSAFAVVGLVALAGADPCSVQLGRGDAPCMYSTSDCLSGSIQWNYPTNDCQFTFTPQGAAVAQLSANWATAEYTNLTFYDGTGSSANVLAFVAGTGDEARVNLTSSTGVIHVKLRGPTTMMTYALIFEYTLTPKTKNALYDGDCNKCLSAGFSMMSDDSCVAMCPMDVACWSGTTGVDSICNERRKRLDKIALCASHSDCEACLGAGCDWNLKANDCISGCGFFPCELATTCPADIMRVKGQFSQASSLGIPLGLMAFGLLVLLN